MKRLELSSQRFGRLTVISIDEPETILKKETCWRCVCDCGNTKTCAGWLLKNGKIKSCGCLYLKNERTGEVHGKWTVLDYSKNEMWNCICECGTKRRVSASSLSSKRSTSCGCVVSPSDKLYKERKKIKIISNITKTEEGCWDWNLYKSDKGYGTTCYRRKSGQRINRVVWTLWHGEIPEGMLVCHQCDRPQCCNPNHLFLGTHEVNMQDMALKGRACQGKNSHLHKTNRYKNV